MLPENVTVVEHPLLGHLVARIRDGSTGSGDFRNAVRRISSMLVYECLRDLPTEEKEVVTPLEACVQSVVDEGSVVLVPILRAGLGMLEGALDLVPDAGVGHIGMERDTVTHRPREYYCKLPKGIEGKTVVVIDPMLATGGSASAAVSALKGRGCTNIRLVCIVGAPEGVSAMHSAHPDVPVYLAALDRCLDDDCYILPGLGDAGDRIFGTLRSRHKISKMFMAGEVPRRSIRTCRSCRRTPRPGPSRARGM